MAVLLGIALEAASGNYFRGHFWGATLWNRIGEQLCTPTLNNNLEKSHFWDQVWGGLALEHNFAEQLSAATLGSSFRVLVTNTGEKFWGTTLENFPDQLLGNFG